MALLLNLARRRACPILGLAPQYPHHWRPLLPLQHRRAPRHRQRPTLRGAAPSPARGLPPYPPMFIRAATYSGRVALSIRHASFHHATSVYLISILHQSDLRRSFVRCPLCEPMAYYSGGGGFLCVAHCHVTHSFSVATLFYMDGQTKGMVMLTNLRGTVCRFLLHHSSINLQVKPRLSLQQHGVFLLLSALGDGDPDTVAVVVMTGKLG
ncbi:uncharacterized protein [Lolium perenne]|uniref:uncharacterized protein n=1 Tax=Lolium perenne TaxID=4522 RepID=UPI003A98F0A4